MKDAEPIDRDTELRDQDGLTEKEFLGSYDAGDYERPSVAADMVIFTVAGEKEENYRRLPERSLRVLLIKRGAHPYLGHWALPGGFVRPNETADQAAARELREETGVDRVYLEQLHTFSDVGRDPRTWVMSCAYMALVDSQEMSVQSGDDADRAEWFGLTYRMVGESRNLLDEGGMLHVRRYELKLNLAARADNNEAADGIELNAIIEQRCTRTNRASSEEYRIVEGGGLAFDHAKIIAMAIERLRSQVEKTDLALHLMPEFFTLTEFQQVYEAILDRELLKAAFRRKAEPLVEKTDRYTENAGHRPSRLYRRRREEWGDY
ncbi:NUDIX domain-containing protein [Saccharibacillus kuerlensis]|uniref:ADP-ribose pyrophosphatase n=1 Tax=Saccharibacillus kuerlensis TaxID=459527 RepID=A0ABQ2KVX5_9BACL|nr:NUDIX domain-containing protein [Saccharibacillus kuerlensis]GGN94384.1 ADP-ribose pyrophosphatase [Saccharibacillus kuerlensis]